MINDIDSIINDYLKYKIEYSQFSYFITPYIFKAIDKQIDDESLRQRLISIFKLIELFLDDEYFYEHDLKKSLKSMT